jgi:uncharacterized protein (DUF1697 family)
MVYVALLRGINVGGNAKIEMPRLKALFESLGCENVSTYINSGNVIFRDSQPPQQLAPLIEKVIAQKLKLPVRVVLRDLANIQKLCQEIPAGWTNDKQQKTDVLFLWDEIDNKDILDKVVINSAIENVRYIAGTLVWNIERENVARGGGIKLIKTNLYRHVTARNINTVRKLRELMSNI